MIFFFLLSLLSTKDYKVTHSSYSSILYQLTYIMACVFAINYTWQTHMNDFLRSFITQESFFELMKNCNSFDDWKERIESGVDIVFTVPMEKGNHMVNRSFKKLALKHKDLTAACKLAEAKLKQGSKPRKKSKLSKRDILRGPKPRGCPPCATIDGPKTGYTKGKGDKLELWEWAPEDPEARKVWKSFFYIKAKKSDYGHTGESVPQGRFVPVSQASNELLAFYLMEPVQEPEDELKVEEKSEEEEPVKEAAEKAADDDDGAESSDFSDDDDDDEDDLYLRQQDITKNATESAIKAAAFAKNIADSLALYALIPKMISIKAESKRWKKDNNKKTKKATEYIRDAYIQTHKEGGSYIHKDKSYTRDTIFEFVKSQIIKDEGIIAQANKYWEQYKI